jgi:type VI secretion system protein ImpH
MAGENGRQTVDLKKELLAEGRRFSFVQAVRFLLLLMRRDEGTETDINDLLKRIRARPELSLAFPESDVTAIQELPDLPSRFSITTTFLGLYGTSSPLPTFYTEDLLHEQAQDRSVSRDFIDIFNSRLYALYFAVWSHYRLCYKIEEAGDLETVHRLYCLLGYEGGTLRGHLDDAYSLLRYTGLFIQRPRSAEGLRTLLADRLGEASVEIDQAVERSAVIPEDQRCYLDQSGCGLGETAYLGERIADRTGKIRVCIGPVKEAVFSALLPDQPLFREIGQMIRHYVDQPLCGTRTFP